MRKFSNNKVISLNEKNENQETKENIEVKILTLMDRLLTLETNGSIDARFLGTVSIKGKELLAKAILDLFIDDKNNIRKNILESLKLKINDWSVLDSEIELLENFSNMKLSIRETINRNIENQDKLRILLESKISKIKNKKKLQVYIDVINESDIQYKNELLDICLNKLKY